MTVLRFPNSLPLNRRDRRARRSSFKATLAGWHQWESAWARQDHAVLVADRKRDGPKTPMRPKGTIVRVSKGDHRCMIALLEIACGKEGEKPRAQEVCYGGYRAVAEHLRLDPDNPSHIARVKRWMERLRTIGAIVLHATHPSVGRPDGKGMANEYVYRLPAGTEPVQLPRSVVAASTKHTTAQHVAPPPVPEAEPGPVPWTWGSSEPPADSVPVSAEFLADMKRKLAEDVAAKTRAVEEEKRARLGGFTGREAVHGEPAPSSPDPDDGGPERIGDILGRSDDATPPEERPPP